MAVYYNVINNDRTMTIKERDIRKILEEVTVDCKDNGLEWTKTDRLQAIERILDDSDYHLLYRGRLSYIYGKKPVENQTVVLISSHVDCVFQQLFCEDCVDCNLRGTFDNSLTNACVLYEMLQGNMNENVIVAFTGDEEEDGGGAYEVMKVLGRWNTRIAIAMVLDLTERGWDEERCFTVENDLGIDIKTGARMMSMLWRYHGKYAIVHESEPDESFDYDEEEVPCFTLGMPVLGDMHSEEGVLARPQALMVYCDIITDMANLLVASTAFLERSYYLEFNERPTYIVLTGIRVNENDCKGDYIAVREVKGTLALPSRIYGKPVREINDFCMMGGGRVMPKSLFIPNTIKNLGKKNFSQWNSLEKVMLHCESDALRDWNFAYCDNLTEVVCMTPSVYDFCKNIATNHSEGVTGCFDRCLDRIEFRRP